MSPTQSAQTPPSLKGNERPGVLDGRRPKDSPSPRASDRAEVRPSLHAQCVACGAPAHDWRRLLGIGATIIATTPDAESVIVRHSAACGRCGATDLVVTAFVGASEAA